MLQKKARKLSSVTIHRLKTIQAMLDNALEGDSNSNNNKEPSISHSKMLLLLQANPAHVLRLQQLTTDEPCSSNSKIGISKIQGMQDSCISQPYVHKVVKKKAAGATARAAAAGAQATDIHMMAALQFLLPFDHNSFTPGDAAFSEAFYLPACY